MSRFWRIFDRELELLARARKRIRQSPRERPPARTERVRLRTRPHARAGGATSAPHRIRPDRTWRRLRRWAPSVYGPGISLGAHALLILTLLWLLPARESVAPARRYVAMTVRLQRPTPAPLPSPTLEPPAPEPTAEPLPRPTPPEPAPRAPQEEIAVDEEPPERAPAEVTLDLEAPPLPTPSTPRAPVVGAGSRSPGRSPGDGSDYRTTRGEGRAEALRRYGGSGGTEDAVARGLAWLAAHQDRDGKWDADGFHRHCPNLGDCPGKGGKFFDTGVTSLALLAFLGGGHSPGRETAYREVVRRGLDHLLRHQGGDGSLAPRSQWLFYNHALATFALAEAHGMSGDPRYGEAVQKALAFSAAHQQSGGGWDYTEERTGRNDLSITGWQVMALNSARNAGIRLPSAVARKARAFVDAAVLRDGQAVYADSGVGRGRKGVNMAAVGLLSRLYLGAPVGDERVQNAADLLVRNPPDVERTYYWDRYFQSTYYWYAATLSLFHLGGARWDAWNHFMQRTLLRLQSDRPHESGSWDPDGNWIGTFGGRIMSTSLLVLTFEIYYRYPPLHAYRKT